MTIELPQKERADFCRRWGIVRLELFGSALRDDFRPDSDIDFLYTPGPAFRRDRAYGPWLNNNMADELSALLGRKVDLIEREKMERHRNWIRREHVLSSALSIYVER
ncbi:MAG: nucleotidyltransferase domain-containing protein [Acidobacteriota bacterium]